ncbi:hypothetical protein BH09PSE5_BH09PSE5_16900 [soil metagenome]
MNAIRPVADSIDQTLNARTAQANAALNYHFENMDGNNTADWDAALDLKEDLVNATFAQQQNFIIQHHLAKTILSTT